MKANRTTGIHIYELALLNETRHHDSRHKPQHVSDIIIIWNILQNKFIK